MHRIKKKLELSAADTEPITNLRREGKALQIETIDQDSEFTESASLFHYEKIKSTPSSTLNYFSWVIYSYIVAVTCLGDAPNSNLTFNVFKPHIIELESLNRLKKHYKIWISFWIYNFSRYTLITPFCNYTWSL